MNPIPFFLAVIAAGLTIELAALLLCRHKIIQLTWQLANAEFECRQLRRFADASFNDQRAICEYLGIEIVDIAASRKAQKIARKKEAA